jgi:hypothetical protein
MNVSRESSSSPPPVNRVQEASPGSASGSGADITRRQQGQAIDPGLAALPPRVHSPNGASASRPPRGHIRRQSESTAGETGGASGSVQHQTPSSRQAGVSWPQPQTSASTRSMNLPRSLSDLPAWRQSLLNAPEGSLSRQYGERLRDLQESRASGQIDQTTFEERANQIAEDLKDHENDLPYWDHHVANSDVGLQYLRFSAQVGGVAVPTTADGRAAVLIRYAAEDAVTEAMRGGATAEQAVQQATQQHGITHAQDLAALQQHATQLAATGGPRVPITTRYAAEDAVTEAMRGGATAEQAVQQATQQHGITHAQDLAALQQHAARLGS